MADLAPTPAAPPVPTSRSHRRPWLWVGLGLIGLCALGVAVLPALEQTATGPATPGVQAPPPPRQIKALGEVLPVSDVVTIAGPTGQDAGRIARIDVVEGDAVIAGQVLAVLDSEPLLQAQLEQAKATEEGKRVALAVRTADLSSTEAQLEARIGEQRVALDRAELDLATRTTLRDSGLYVDSALRALQLGVEAARHSLRNLEVQLDRSRLRTDSGLRLDAQSAASDLASARAARSKAEADYAKAYIRAPIAGRVLAVHGRVGQQIDSGGFGEIGDTSRMIIRAEVYETDVSGVALGQQVTATSRAFDRVLAGTVSRLGVRLSGQSILSTDPAAIVDARVVEVWITLDDASSRAVMDRTGLQVTVAFTPEGNGDA